MSIFFLPKPTSTVVKGARTDLVTTQRSQTGASYVDVTSITVTVSGLNASKTYHCVAMVSGAGAQGGGGTAFYKLLIDTTKVAETSTGSASLVPICLAGFATFTGATSVVAKLQYKGDAGGITSYFSSTAIDSTISLIVAEQ